MNGKNIKQILASVSLAGLIAGAGLTLPGCYSDMEGGKTGSESAVEKHEQGATGCSGSADNDQEQQEDVFKSG